MSTKEAQEVAFWITEREAIRIAKEREKPRPWTTDPILKEYRFCNVRREDDAVTKWIAANWRNPNYDHPMLLRAMALARMVNWPPTLDIIGFPETWHPEAVVNAINSQASCGKAWGSAYIVSTNGRAMSKALYVVYEVCGKLPATPLPARATSSLQAFYNSLLVYNGLGSFMAGQLIADLKNTPGHPLEEAPDWWSWACPGPGSKRGLARYFKGRDGEPTFELGMEVMMDEVGALLPKHIGRIHAQDWQNVMCEMGKYWRTKDGRGRPKARYTPNPTFP